MKDEEIVQFMQENIGKTIELKTKGKSMHPLIKENSVVNVKVMNADKLKRGDIALFFSGKRFVAHRILNKKGNLFLVKGDNNMKFDAMVDKKKVVGKITEINGKKTDSFEFELMKIPVLAFSYTTGILSKIKAKK